MQSGLVRAMFDGSAKCFDKGDLEILARRYKTCIAELISYAKLNMKSANDGFLVFKFARKKHRG